MRLNKAIALIAATLIIGCGGEKKVTESSIKDSFESKGTTTLLEEASKDKYTPPADGRLTEKQVEMYLKVKDREKEIARVARKQLEEQGKKADAAGEKSLTGMVEAFKGMGTVADFLTADIRAAKELGYNSAEYQWVKTTILGVSTAAWAEKTQQAVTAMSEATYVNLKQQYDAAKDEQTKAMLKQTLDQYEKGRQEMAAQQTPRDAAYEYNEQLLSKYEATFKALETELAKYTNTDEEAKKQVGAAVEGMEKAASDAKKQGQ